MKIKMLKTKMGSDGFIVKVYEKDKIYDVPDSLGQDFRKWDLAELVVTSDKFTPEQSNNKLPKCSYRAGRTAFHTLYSAKCEREVKWVDASGYYYCNFHKRYVYMPDELLPFHQEQSL